MNEKKNANLIGNQDKKDQFIRNIEQQDYNPFGRYAI